MIVKIIYLTLVYSIGFQLVLSQRYVGDVCTLQRTGESGQCQIIQNCPVALDLFHSQGISPQNCGFQDNTPIVCCVPRKPPPKPVLTYLSTTPFLNQGEVYVATKSRQKCQEYGQYEFAESSPNLLPGLQYTATCPFPSVDFLPRYIAKPREFPHMAAIGYDGQNREKVWSCSGSLISERFVLTAAHCLRHPTLGDAKYVRLGDLTLNSDTDAAKPQEFNIIERIGHPNYRPPVYYNNIALLKMDKAAQFNAYVKPACLNTDPTLTTKMAIVSGWGKVTTPSSGQDLYMAKLTYSAYTQCNSSYSNRSGLTQGIMEQSQICAEAEDSCQTDSGGPLQIYNNLESDCTYKIIGVTSLPKPCDDMSVPGVYTRVSKYIPWIESIVWL